MGGWADYVTYKLLQLCYDGYKICSTDRWGTCDVMQKESKEGTPNLVLLLMQGKVNSRIEDVSAYISKILDRTKHELVEHVLMDDKNCVPKPCRRLHLNVTTIFQMFYNSANVFDSATALVGSINKAFYDPFSSLGMPSPEQIYEQVEPCLYYVTDKGAKPTKGCCDGVKQLLGWGKSHADRVYICNCLKEGAKQIPDLDQKRVVALPQLCGVDYSIPLDPNIDCNTIP
ncbi:hypothetical protein ACLOJK_010202 [Asimina triloba]